MHKCKGFWFFDDRADFRRMSVRRVFVIRVDVEEEGGVVLGRGLWCTGRSARRITGMPSGDSKRMLLSALGAGGLSEARAGEGCARPPQGSLRELSQACKGRARAGEEGRVVGALVVCGRHRSAIVPGTDNRYTHRKRGQNEQGRRGKWTNGARRM